MFPALASLQALYVSAGTVALAEIGDKTQLLALLLAARFRRPCRPRHRRRPRPRRCAEARCEEPALK
jgi:hypothetical protein